SALTDLLEPIIINHSGIWSIGVLRRNWRTPIGLVFKGSYRRFTRSRVAYPFRKGATATKHRAKVTSLAVVRFSPIMTASNHS
ncbi:MAG: hypothetical protein ACR2N1_07290, partial [Rubripirellula sp.]